MARQEGGGDQFLQARHRRVSAGPRDHTAWRRRREGHAHTGKDRVQSDHGA